MFTSVAEANETRTCWRAGIDNPSRQELSAASLSLCCGGHAPRGLRRANHASPRIEKNRDNATASQAMRSMTPWIARRTPSSV